MLFLFSFVIFSSCSFEISVISFIFSSFSGICGCIIIIIIINFIFKKTVVIFKKLKIILVYLCL